MNLKIFAAISLMSTAAFITLTFYSCRTPEPISETAILGKKVWQKNNCISCHTLFGHGGYEGSDLTHVTTQKTPQELRNFLQNPQIIRSHIKDVHITLNPTDTEHLLHYFEYLSSIPTLGWPPEAHEFE